MLVTNDVRLNYPFPELIQSPTELAIKLQERIKYMFGITVEPVIIRLPQSFYKTAEFRPIWRMKTLCNRYCIESFEQACNMAEKSAWHVLDFDLFKKPRERIIKKIIY